MSQISGQSSAIPQSEIHTSSVPRSRLTPYSLPLTPHVLLPALSSLRIALKLIKLDIHQQSKSETLKEVKDKPFFTVENAEAEEISVDPVKKRPNEQWRPTVMVISQPPSPLDRITEECGTYLSCPIAAQQAAGRPDDCDFRSSNFDYFSILGASSGRPELGSSFQLAANWVKENKRLL